MRDALRMLLAEPRVADPPPRRGLDYLIAGALAVMSIAVGIMVSDIAWRPVAVLLAVSLTVPLLWGRSHPLQMVALAFGLQAVVDTVAMVATDMSTLVRSTVLVGLILTYQLCRWASGRDAAAGLAIIVTTHIWTEMINPAVPVDDAIVGVTIWVVPAAAAIAVRYGVQARERTVLDARMLERDRLARDLHDTVAHHITAVTIQSQAAQLVARTDPDLTAELLETIERESSRAVDEMQQIVQVLRHSNGATATAMTPQPNLSDIAGLGDAESVPSIEVSLEGDLGDLDDLAPTLQTSLFRVAQEAITNSRRHARHATKISIHLNGTDDDLRLCVRDDGDRPAPRSSSSRTGYGLVGMAERMALVGGTLEAAPGRDRGWVVAAVVPRTETRAR